MNKLRDLLKNTPNVPVKIKTSKSRWIYAYYNDKLAIKRIEKITADYIYGLQIRLLKKKNLYDALDKNFKEKLKQINKPRKKALTQKKKQKLIDNATKKYNHDKVTYPKQINALKNKIKTFVPYLNRKVIEVWKLPNMESYENPKTLYIEITGKEMGDYDDMHDYAKKNHLIMRKGDDKWTSILAHRKEDKENDNANEFIRFHK